MSEVVKTMGAVDELDDETAAVPMSTEGARHVPAAELRERELLETNRKRGAVETVGCPAATRVKRNHFNHTIRCQKPVGHEGGHEAKADNRTTVWYGEAQKLQTDERYRFGLSPHWSMQRTPRPTAMGGDFDSDE